MYMCECIHFEHLWMSPMCFCVLRPFLVHSFQGWWGGRRRRSNWNGKRRENYIVGKRWDRRRKRRIFFVWGTDTRGKYSENWRPLILNETLYYGRSRQYIEQKIVWKSFSSISCGNSCNVIFLSFPSRITSMLWSCGWGALIYRLNCKTKFSHKTF